MTRSWNAGSAAAATGSSTAPPSGTNTLTPRATPVKAVLQHPPAPPRHRQRPTATTAATISGRPSIRHPPRHPPTATTGRHPQRIPRRSLTCTDGISAVQRRPDHVERECHWMRRHRIPSRRPVR
jgi:hypothetical protein